MDIVTIFKILPILQYVYVYIIKMEVVYLY